VLGCYLNLLHPGSEALGEIQAAYRAHLRFASALGCGVVGTETGCPNAEYYHVPECRSGACFEQFARNFTPIVEDAERFGVIIGIEPVWSHSVYDARRARQLLDTMASPNVKIILDPVNLLFDKNAANAGDIVSEALDLLGEDITVFHIKDYVLGQDGFKSVAAGFGEMDYANIMRFAKRYKPHIHATLEDTSPDNAAMALNKMREAYDKA
jgi:sugar phosphate isomerase/epimerase